jgi:hypothetical protein
MERRHWRDAADTAIVITYNEPADRFFTSTAKTRADVSEFLTVSAMTVGEKLHVYLVSAHPNPHGAGYVTSGTAYFTVNVTYRGLPDKTRNGGAKPTQEWAVSRLDFECAGFYFVFFPILSLISV